jgi:hypothetical protein
MQVYSLDFTFAIFVVSTGCGAGRTREHKDRSVASLRLGVPAELELIFVVAE